MSSTDAKPGSDDNIVSMRPGSDHLRAAFLGWQCRLRQYAVREAEARPSAGMRPRLQVAGQDLGPITVVITPLEPASSTHEFRHIVKRTHDPRERYQAALRFLQASFYQDPKAFDDRLTAAFSVDADLPAVLVEHQDCILVFEQFSQCYRLPCRVERLEEVHPAYQATYWHNALFNASLPAVVEVIGFRPDWDHADADPLPA